MPDTEVSRDRIASSPYSKTGVVAVVFPDGFIGIGTFSVVGKNDVITAAHIMHNPSRGGGVKLALFYLGADYNSSTGNIDYQPYPEILYTPSTGRVLTYSSLAFQDGDNFTSTALETPHDVALVGLNSAIGDLAGWLNINPLIRPSFTKNSSSSLLTSPSNLTAISIGYPSGSTGMMERTIQPNLGDGDLTGNWFVGSLGFQGFGDAIIGQGDSGGPLLVGRDLVGIASAGGTTPIPGGFFFDSVHISRWAAISNHFDEISSAISSNDDLIGQAGQNKVTFDYSQSATLSSQSLSGYSANEYFSGGGGNDTIIAMAGDDTLDGGTGADSLIGGAGSDAFVFAAGHSGQAIGSDIISGFAKGAVGTGDLIDYTSDLSIGGSAATATKKAAAINQTTGVAAFASGSGKTITDALADIATRFTAATDAVGEFAFFRVKNTGNFHLFISDGVAGIGPNDVVVQLVGVTTIAGINLTSGNLTITS